MQSTKTKQGCSSEPPHHSDPFLQDLIDRIDEGVVTIDPEGTVLFSNRRFADFVRVPVEKMAGKLISRFIAAYEKKRFDEMIKERESKALFLKTADGKYVLVHLSASEMDVEGRKTICILATLLSETMRLQRIVEGERLARVVFEQSSEAILICDGNGRITRASVATRRFFNKRLFLSSFDKVCPFTITSTSSGDMENFSVSSVLKGSIFRDLEVKHERDDGTTYNFILNAKPLIDSRKIIGCFIALTDITKRKQMEEELRRSRNELEKRVLERTAELQMTNQRVEESEDRLRLLSSQLLSVQETERKRIAMEIHDSFAQSLATIKFRTENILNEIRGNDCANAVKPLESLMPIIQVSIDEARRLQQELRPSILDDLGILATLSWFCREFQKTHPAIRIEQEMEIEQWELPKDLKIVAYRIIQEAMNNVAKHSGASQVHLSLKKVDSVVELAVRDNGHGFNLEDTLSLKGASKGMGLSSMKERADLSGGIFSVESVAGAGTTIKVTWNV